MLIGGRIEGSLLSLEEFNAKFIKSNSIKMSVVIFLYFLAGEKIIYIEVVWYFDMNGYNFCRGTRLSFLARMGYN
jgi:hypothetical protein